MIGIAQDRGAVLVAVFVRSTRRFVLVWESSKPKPWYWKWAGGHIEAYDIDPRYPDDAEHTASIAARRETQEETGLKVHRLIRLGCVDKYSHRLYQYLGIVDNLRDLALRGKEGQFTKEFSVEQIDELQKLGVFHPNHIELFYSARAKIAQIGL